MKVLLLLIGADIVTGISSGFIRKDLNSKYGLIGVMKHSIVVLLVLTFKVIADSYGMLDYYSLFKAFYIIQYIISITENVYKLGIPVPNMLLERLKDYQESEGLDKWQG